MSEYDEQDYEDMYDRIDRKFERIHDYHDSLDDEFRKLCVEPSLKVAKKGDRVIVAGGLIGRGYKWVRLEAVVLEVGDTSVHVEFKDRAYIGGRPDRCWIHPCLITDVLSHE